MPAEPAATPDADRLKRGQRQFMTGLALVMGGMVFGGGLAMVFYFLGQRPGAIVSAVIGVGAILLGILMQASAAKILPEQSAMTFAWMGWTLPTALFFGFIALSLVTLGVLTRLAPKNQPRIGVLGVATQRGDRFFLTLLGAAFIHLAWIGLAPKDAPLWFATAASVVYAGFVFRFV